MVTKRSPSEIPMRYMRRGNAGSMSPAGLRATLEEMGINQCEFARRIGVTARTVRYWLAGNSPVPRWVPHELQEMQGSQQTTSSRN